MKPWSHPVTGHDFTPGLCLQLVNGKLLHSPASSQKPIIETTPGNEIELVQQAKLKCIYFPNTFTNLFANM